VPALVTLEDANFGAIPFDLIGRAPSQMGVAAAFAAADRSNKSLILDDEGTPFHCPARNQYPQHAYNLGKRAELGRQERGCEKPVQNRFAEGKKSLPVPAYSMGVAATQSLLRRASACVLCQAGQKKGEPVDDQGKRALGAIVIYNWIVARVELPCPRSRSSRL
jgi:hypothetical protein